MLEIAESEGNSIKVLSVDSAIERLSEAAFLLGVARGYDDQRRLIVASKDLESLAVMLGETVKKPGRPWTRSYLRAVLNGQLKPSAELAFAIESLAAILADQEPPKRSASLRVAGEVEPGALVLGDSKRCEGCGMPFVPRVPWARYHSAACREAAKKRKSVRC